MEGIYVSKVSEDGAGFEAGIEEGDVITAVDGKRLRRWLSCRSILQISVRVKR